MDGLGGAHPLAFHSIGEKKLAFAADHNPAPAKEQNYGENHGYWVDPAELAGNERAGRTVHPVRRRQGGFAA